MVVESKELVANPIVSVVILTYNHESYISQAIESVLVQKTDFPFEIIIADDASKDGTRQLCLNYQQKHPNIIKLLFQDSNKGVVDNYRDSLSLSRGEYVASFGGDDFWILDTKLQLQKDFLDKHPQYSLCYTNINICDDSGQIIEKGLMNKWFRPQSFEEHLINKSFIAPLTWMYRKKLGTEIDVKGAYTDESFALALDAFAKNEVLYIDVITAVYRFSNNSLSRPNSTEKSYYQWLGVFRAQCYYLEKYKDIVDKNLIMKVKINGFIEFIPTAINLNDCNLIEEAISFFKSIDVDITPYINTCKALKKTDNPRNTYSYKLGHAVLAPFKWIKKILQ